MSETKTRLLDAAAHLTQTRGFHGFSFHDLAKEVGIKTASIHYHFPTKANLGQKLVTRYTEQFFEKLGPADDGSPDACLSRYAGLFRATLDRGRMCLCGMVGAEISGVPAELVVDLKAFFDRNRDWLTSVISRSGVAQPALQAQILLATLEGALLIARVAEDVGQFDAIIGHAIEDALRNKA
jgi:TetR/AcrR family transcriptional regulator, transcriptional repressor for nem operon